MQETRALFLRMFTAELINNSKPQIFVPIIQEEKKKPTPNLQVLPVNAPELQQQIKPTNLPKPELTYPSPGINLKKIESLLQDESISMVECPGPEKLVLVNQLGGIKTTKISLSEEEIREVIEKFAEEAHIPLMTGIFKAAVKNFIITAVLSEFVGSRFIIMKMMPQQIY